MMDPMIMWLIIINFKGQSLNNIYGEYCMWLMCCVVCIIPLFLFDTEKDWCIPMGSKKKLIVFQRQTYHGRF